ncbi:serine/threonine-protein kinase [Streptomyces sp. CC210A]|uniref:serine/threonine-protein kinase n=1 Tax=Streptomyces sp. CC210A TaxID=2898184 RepID=UPI001F465F39|nr:serine/threonine-protein kinase [Streptomyces sp. CC210A]
MEALTTEDPATIGPFRLLGRLGTGGMGRVYLARSAGGRTVAVKVVHPELAAQDEFRRRFAREVAALEKVGGTGTTPVLGADTEAEAPWVAIGYVAGPSLKSVVGTEYGPLPPATVRALTAGVARALERVHAAGLIHRDLKPANVLLAVDGPRIIDFGIARAVDTVTDGGLTSTGAVVGSPGFMSPEQVRGERLTPASDVFCLGSVLAYAATGRAPFGTADSGVHAMMFRIAHDEPDLAGLPPELDGLVRPCLAKDPADRPTAGELAAAADEAADAPTTHDGAPHGTWLPAEVLAGLGRHAARLLDADGDPTPTDHPAALDPRADTPADPGPDRRPRRPRRRTLLAGACAALALALGGTALAVAYWPEGDAPGGIGTGGGKEVPAAFAGAWEGAVRGAADHPQETLRIEIGPGDTTASYSNLTADRLCLGRSALTDSGSDGRSITLTGSDVTLSLPAERCTPAPRHTLTLRSAQVLEWRSGTASATLRKVESGPEVVPDRFVGTWERKAEEEVPDTPPDLYDERLVITQGPIGAPVLRLVQSNPELDEETGERTGRTLTCASTGVLAGSGDLVLVGPLQLDADASDRECRQNSLNAAPSSPGVLRVERVDGEERLLSAPFGEDTSYAVFARKY